MLAGSAIAPQSFAANQPSESAATVPPSALVFSHPRIIDNPHLPLSLLKQDILEGNEDGKKVRIERTVKNNVHKMFSIGSKIIDSLAVEDREFENGKLSEVTLDYFAQADDGTVLYLGEDVNEYRNGEIVGHEGAWSLGVDTKTPGVMMPGHLKVGVKFKSEDVNKDVHEEDEIVSMSETVKVPAGTFKNCVKVKETLAEGGSEYKYFAPGVGCVREVPVVGDVLLISHQTKADSDKSSKNPNLPQSAQRVPDEKVFQDPDARDALELVGFDGDAEMYWFDAIHDKSLPLSERQDLIDDLNEAGLADPKHPTPDDLPLILNRLEVLQELAPTLGKDLDWQECYGDLLNLVDVANGGGKPVQ